MADTKVSAETLVSAIKAGYKMYIVCDTGVAPDSNAATMLQVQDFIRTAFGTANDTGAGFIEAAVQSEMETGTDTTRAVVPGRQQYHPSAAKAWCLSDGATTPAISASYNVTSLTDNGVGDTTFNFTTAMSSVSYSAVALFKTSVTFSTNAAPRSIDIVSLGTGGARIATGAWISTGSVAIDYPIHMVAFGDQ